MATIELTNVTKRWGQFYGVDNLDLLIGDNAFVTLLGPSGCGKTTTLRMIAGLETPTSGRITIDGVPVFDSELGINIPANKRKVGFLFQNYALWPNMTVYQNVSFGLSNIKEEMAIVDIQAKTTAQLIDALKKPEKIVKIVNSCRDKNGKLDEEKAVLHLIDTFELSTFTAKKLVGYHLQDAKDVKNAAAQAQKDLSSKLEGFRAKHKEQGNTLNESFEVVKGGKVQTSVRKLDKEEIDLIVRRVSRIVKIGMFMDRYPAELSGGQQQRVAIARTLAPDPKVLFMDEPLSNLDAKLRLEMRSELQRLHLQTGSTFVYVTHDQMEAMTLATKICLLDNGVLQQYEEPLSVYNRPANLFVADFVGNPAVNFIDGVGKQQTDGTVELTIWDGQTAVFEPNESVHIDQWYVEAAALEKVRKAEEVIAQKSAEKSNKDVVFKHHIAKVDETDFQENVALTQNDFVVGVRPEFISICDDGPITGEIFSAMPTGMETTVKIRVGEYLLTGVVFGGVLYKIGQSVKLNFIGTNAMLFSRSNGRMIAQGSMKVRG